MTAVVLDDEHTGGMAGGPGGVSGPGRVSGCQGIKAGENRQIPSSKIR
jgi:hypothetical protein